MKKFTKVIRSSQKLQLKVSLGNKTKQKSCHSAGAPDVHDLGEGEADPDLGGVGARGGRRHDEPLVRGVRGHAAAVSLVTLVRAVVDVVAPSRHRDADPAPTRELQRALQFDINTLVTPY